MELWLDTIDLEMIKLAAEMGSLKGVTTNPAILSHADMLPELKLKQILEIHPGLLAAQVVADELGGMIDQAQELYDLAPGRMIIKIPTNPTGLKAMTLLAKNNIPTMATAVFEPSQVYLAAVAGAKYVAPYLSWIMNESGNYADTLTTMLQLISQQQFDLKLLAAAIISKEQVIACAQLGAQAITLPVDIYQTLLSPHKLTEKSLVMFGNAWSQGKHTNSSELFN